MHGCEKIPLKDLPFWCIASIKKGLRSISKAQPCYDNSDHALDRRILRSIAMRDANKPKPP